MRERISYAVVNMYRRYGYTFMIWRDWGGGSDQLSIRSRRRLSVVTLGHRITYRVISPLVEILRLWRRNPQTFRYVDRYIIYTCLLVLRTSFRTHVAYRGALEYTFVSFIRGRIANAARAARKEAV
jgi:hypothetical protein